MRINKIQQNNPNFQKIKFSEKTQTIIQDTIRTNLESCSEAKADYINVLKFKIENICRTTINMFALGEKSYKDFNNECIRSYGKSDRILEDLDVIVEDIKGLGEKHTDGKGTTITYSLPQLNYKNEYTYGVNFNLSDALDIIGSSLPTQIKAMLIKDSPLKKEHNQNQLPQRKLDEMIDNLFK